MRDTVPPFFSGKTTSSSFIMVDQEVNLPEKRCPRRFMVDQEVNLPEKSGVVTAELTFKLCTNSFGSEDS